MSADTKTQYPITVHLTCRDVPRSIAFYRDTLGFELKECWPDESKPMFASLLLDRQAILLGAHLPADKVGEWCGDDAAMKRHAETVANEFESNAAGAGVTIYLRVEDIDGYHALLVERGVKGMLDPKTQFYGQRDFPLRDPDGYRLTFYAPVTMTTS